MKIAIHHNKGSFSDRWIAYCEEKQIDYKLVDCYHTDIIEQLKDCDALMWHFDQSNYKDMLFARQLLYSVKLMGKKVFPDFNTCWHFDDKVGQKYLLEAVGAPFISSYVFYTEQEALVWAQSNSFPKVFKLRGGAGSMNVKLVKNKRVVRKYIHKAFHHGYPVYDRWSNFKERLRKYKEGKDSFVGILKGLGRLVIPTQLAKMQSPEKGYVYFQDFIPDNRFDIRVIVIGDKAFAIKRMVRKNDFRASGSGNIKYEREEFDERCVRIAFDANKKLESQCIAYDFVFDSHGQPFIVEISYGFVVKVYDPCAGYWDKDMNWHAGAFNPQEWIIRDLISEVDNK